MTRKHFAAIAEEIADAKEDYPTEEAQKALEQVARGIAEQCRAINGRFQFNKFMTACGF